MMRKVNWGILSTAKIAREKVIPAMMQSEYCRVIAIASRDTNKATETALHQGIPKTFNSYEDMLNDSEIEAVYIPLPNHMHVQWAMAAMLNGKHVLCEKPIALSQAEAESLLVFSKKHPQLKLMEAFMYRFHPQWQQVKTLVQNGAVGKVKTIQAFFSYFNADPNNIRNQKHAGGGGLMDIGCYCISQSRFILNAEPLRVLGIADRNPSSQTDILTSALLDFGHATVSFTCSTQLNPFQRFHVFGTEGSIEVEIPVNIPFDVPSRLWLHKGKSTEEILFEPVNQYTLQADSFSKCIIEQTAVPFPLEDAINNMKVIEAIFESDKHGKWMNVN